MEFPLFVLRSDKKPSVLPAWLPTDPEPLLHWTPEFLNIASGFVWGKPVTAELFGDARLKQMLCARRRAAAVTGINNAVNWCRPSFFLTDRLRCSQSLWPTE
jgi:hypothetical protein